MDGCDGFFFVAEVLCGLILCTTVGTAVPKIQVFMESILYEGIKQECLCSLLLNNIC